MNVARLKRDEVLGYDEYVKCRSLVRKTMINIRKTRSVALTDNIRLVFENKHTIQYQIQEILYASRCSCPDEIDEQISTYQHLLPDTGSVIATLMLEYTQAAEAEQQINQLKGIESTVYLQVEGFERVWPIANEDVGGIPIISAVHYLRFDLNTDMLSAFRQGANLLSGIAHGACLISAKLMPSITQNALKNDLNPIN